MTDYVPMPLRLVCRHPRISLWVKTNCPPPWTELNRYLEILRQQNAPEVPFLQELSNLLLEFMIATLITHALDKKDEHMEAFRHKVAALIAQHETDASKFPWMSALAEWGSSRR